MYWLSHAQAHKRTNKPKHTEEGKVEKRSEVEQGRSGEREREREREREKERESRSSTQPS